MPATAYELLQQSANKGRVRLSPSAISFHPSKPAAHGDQWIPTVGDGGTVQLNSCSTGHFWRLAPSDVLHVEADPAAPSDGLVHLRVTLRRRLWLQGPRAGWLPRRAAWRRIPVTSRTVWWTPSEIAGAESCERSSVVLQRSDYYR